jgi:hypothetical protein
MVSPPEKRTDPEAGEQYTRDEFLEIYGGTEEWDAAGQAGRRRCAPSRGASLQAPGGRATHRFAPTFLNLEPVVEGLEINIFF